MMAPPLDRARAREMRSRGFWRDKTLHDYFGAALHAHPDKVALVDCASPPAPPLRLTYRQLDLRSERIASALVGLGVLRGDVVSVQLPNCWQFIALALACARIGAVINPLMPIFRERELELMLNQCKASVLVVPRTWRCRDHAAMARAMLPRVPGVRHLVVLDGAEDDGFEAMLPDDGARQPASRAAAAGRQPLAADEVALVMFTSGTTGAPKGVMHTSNTLLSTLDAALRSLQMSPADVALCSAPMGHMLGLALLGIFPLMAMGRVVIMDGWEVGAAVRLMHDENVTFMAGPTPYLVDLCGAIAAGSPRPPGLRVFCCAGAPIPPVLIERADKDLNMTVCSLFGMTEVQAGMITAVDAGRALSAVADGRPSPGMEVKVVDEGGQVQPIGQTGRLLIRGSSLFAGYLGDEGRSAVDAEGWFDTGDLAYVVNDEGYVRLNGRTKDIIKRGGESVPVVEVEALLARHPAVASVAIVGWPDPRLGERVCAFVTLRPGATFTLEAMRAYLRDCQLTPQYWPERIEVCADLPRTPSGKVQKFRLRELVQSFPD